MFGHRSNAVRMLFVAVSLAQMLLGARVLWRLVRTGMRATIIPPADGLATDEPVTVIVPVLNEFHRLRPCLEGLLVQGPEVTQILVVDGGSADGTRDMVASFTLRDPRVRLIDASPVPGGWNGKAWGLQRGLDQVGSDTRWILTIDADVRPQARLARSLVDFANCGGLRALSVATRQEIETLGEGLVHPAFLTTLVYRFGIPGSIAGRPAQVQANGQCFLIQRDLLEAVGQFTAVRSSVCEDVTLAREVVAAGHRIGFFEAGDLVSVRMYPNGLTTVREWPRSLPMRDRFFGWSGVLGLAEVLLVQAAPLPLMVLHRRLGLPRWMIKLETALALTRIGVLVGTRRAYRRRPISYWLSPLFDLPASLLLLASAVRRRYVWRGRTLARGGPS